MQHSLQSQLLAKWRAPSCASIRTIRSVTETQRTCSRMVASTLPPCSGHQKVQFHPGPSRPSPPCQMSHEPAWAHLLGFCPELRVNHRHGNDITRSAAPPGHNRIPGEPSPTQPHLAQKNKLPADPSHRSKS